LGPTKVTEIGLPITFSQLGGFTFGSVMLSCK